MSVAGRLLSRRLRCCLRFVGVSSPRIDLTQFSQNRIITECRSFHSATRFSAKKKDTTKKLKRPVDDVYLANLYDAEVYDVGNALTTLKRYMELDFEDKDSPVRLILDLHLAPKGRGKLQSFWQITEPVHKFPYSNRVCVFTDDSTAVQQCYDYGAFYAGGQDIMQRVIYGKEQCDAFVSTQEFFKANLQNNAEMKRAIGKLLPTRSRGINEDLVAELVEMRDGMLIHNQRADVSKSTVVIGIIDQPVHELKDNLLLALEIVQKEQNPKHPPIINSASVSCCEENLAFEIEEEDDL